MGTLQRQSWPKYMSEEEVINKMKTVKLQPHTYIKKQTRDNISGRHYVERCLGN